MVATMESRACSSHTSSRAYMSACRLGRTTPTLFFCKALSVGPRVGSGVPNQLRFQSITLRVEAGSMLLPLTLTTSVESEMLTRSESINWLLVTDGAKRIKTGSVLLLAVAAVNETESLKCTLSVETWKLPEDRIVMLELRSLPVT